MAVLIDCKKISAQVKDECKERVAKKNTLDYKVMQFQGEVRSPHMYEEKNRS